MEAVKNPGTPPPDTRQAETAARLSLVPSPDEKGFFYTDHEFYPDYELPDYDSAVDTAGIKPLGEPVPHQGYGTVYKEEWPMLDAAGTRYQVARCLAERPVSNVWVAKDTAWITQIEGANMDIARKLMKIGFNVLVKGPEIGSSIPLSQSAYHTHLVLDELQARDEAVDTSAVALEGYSRGSMIGFGTNAYAARFGRKIIYSNLTDPCVGRPIQRDLATVKKAVTLPADILMLELAVGRSLLDVRRGRHLLKTIDPTPKGLLQFVRTGWPLMNGEAGKMAARTPLDMQATIAFFRRCQVNDVDLYQEILADRPGVRFVRPEGGHGGGLDRRIIGNIAVRFSRLADQLAEGRAADELDYRRITYGQAAA
ncbi:MAG TPA: hypothetical protein VHC21_04080 [Candidatus Saccharimonadales bacterium]|nr:hypothetical protein [Candidatus Saccharimonadales bacterium]